MSRSITGLESEYIGLQIARSTHLSHSKCHLLVAAPTIPRPTRCRTPSSSPCMSIHPHAFSAGRQTTSVSLLAVRHTSLLLGLGREGSLLVDGTSGGSQDESKVSFTNLKLRNSLTCTPRISHDLLFFHVDYPSTHAIQHPYLSLHLLHNTIHSRVFRIVVLCVREGGSGCPGGSPGLQVSALGFKQRD